MSLLPQFGFVELMVVAIVALIVVGPKDLPKLMRSCGQMIAKARHMAGEFTNAFDEMARETEMEELRAEMDAMRFDHVAEEVKGEVEEAFRPITDEVHETVSQGKAQHAATAASLGAIVSPELSDDDGDDEQASKAGDDREHGEETKPT